MPDPRHSLGARAERAAARWLADGGWHVLERRCRPALGSEIDLVALDPGGVLVAVEVRARRTPRAGAAAESIDGRRIRRLRAALTAYALASGHPHAGLRVDAVVAEPTADRRVWRLVRVPAIG